MKRRPRRLLSSSARSPSPLRRWRLEPSSRPGPARLWLLDITLPVALNLVLVASALGLLATDLRPMLRLFMPDLFWLIVISGGFALVWSIVRTRLILQVSRGDA